MGKLAELAADAKRFFSTGKLKPTRGKFLSRCGGFCCGMSGAYFSHQRTFRLVKEETIVKAIRRRYELSDEELRNFWMGYDDLGTVAASYVDTKCKAYKTGRQLAMDLGVRC